MTTESLVRVADDDFERAARALIAAKGSENTRKAYSADLETWIAFCFRLGTHPKRASLETATAFREYLIAECSKSTARRALAAMSGIYRVLLASKMVTANPFHTSVLAWPPGAAINKTRRVTDEVALAMFADALADPDVHRGGRDLAILQTLYGTGLRRASVASLRRDDYSDGKLRAIVKGGKETENNLPPDTIEALDRWLAIAPPSEFIFPGNDPRRPLHPLTINKLVNNRSRAVGAKGVHPHCFRAEFITAGYEAGIPEYQLQASVHHSDSKTTRRYNQSVLGRNVATQLSEFRKGKPKP